MYVYLKKALSTLALCPVYSLPDYGNLDAYLFSVKTLSSINQWPITINHVGFDETIIEMNVDCTDTGKSYFDDFCLHTLHLVDSVIGKLLPRFFIKRWITKKKTQWTPRSAVVCSHTLKTFKKLTRILLNLE